MNLDVSLARESGIFSVAFQRVSGKFSSLLGGTEFFPLRRSHWKWAGIGVYLETDNYG